MTVDTALTGRTPEQEECLRQLCGDIRNAVATWGRAGDRLARLVSDFCNRTDHGISKPRNYIGAVIGCDKATVSRLIDFADTLPVVADLLPNGNKLPLEFTLRPIFPLLDDHATVRAAIGDALKLVPGGKRLTAKYVRKAAEPYLAEIREKHKPRGGAAHKRFVEPNGAAAPDDLGMFLSSLLRDAVAAIKGQAVPDSLSAKIQDAYEAVREFAGG